jgi:hypothetical protein
MTARIPSPSKAFASSRARLAMCSVLIVCVFGLGGCSEARQTLGLERTAPDEFQVVSRAPLSVPPEFQLRPPEPGAPRPQEGETRDQAREALLGTKATYDRPDLSRGERLLLKKAGTDQAVADIRALVNQETNVLIEDDASFVDDLVFWRADTPYGSRVDPAKESRRIQENQALNRPVTDGEVPVIERKKKAILEGIF